jgi:hypothetical protein
MPTPSPTKIIFNPIYIIDKVDAVDTLDASKSVVVDILPYPTKPPTCPPTWIPTPKPTKPPINIYPVKFNPSIMLP